ADGLPEAQTTNLTYFSRLADAETFTRQAYVEAYQRGTESAAVVCAVQDGAEWLQGLVDVLRPDAVRILDFPHAVEHLTAAVQPVLGAGTPAFTEWLDQQDRKSTRLNSSHVAISYAVFCLKKKNDFTYNLSKRSAAIFASFF